ncbi:hypothetical protein M9458_040677, partial [Cirrhinus mrigala]
ALDYLHNLAKDLGAPSESSTKNTSKSGEADGADQKKKTPRGTKRKTPDHESDLDDDEDFSPGNDEEEEDDEEDSEPDFSLT